MWLPLKVLARLFVITGVAVTLIAITLGRYGITLPDERRPAAPKLQPVNIHVFDAFHNDLLMLDVEAGRPVHLPLTDSQLIKFAGCSPWKDQRGQTQLVGLWMGRPRPDQDLATGLTRYALPSNEVLDRIEMTVLPASPPCWFPDTSARILFAGSDGLLYRFAFESAQTIEPTAHDTLQPQPLTWRTDPPANLIAITAPNWPTDPRLKGKLIASLILATEGPTHHQFPPRQSNMKLWWLELSRDGSAIVAAGPLDPHGRVDSAECMALESMPVVGTRDDGRLVIAYLARGNSEGTYRLRLAPLTIQRPSSVPSVDQTAAVDLSGDYLLSPPAFSPDGRWLYAIAGSTQGPPRVARFSVDDALSKRPPEFALTEQGSAPIPQGEQSRKPEQGQRLLAGEPVKAHE